MDESKFNLTNLLETLLANVGKTAWKVMSEKCGGGYCAHIKKFSICFTGSTVSVKKDTVYTPLSVRNPIEKEILKKLYIAVADKVRREEEANREITESSIIKKVLEELEK